MVSEFKMGKSLTEQELRNLYPIYEHAFGSKDIPTRSFEEWKEFVSGSYCYTQKPFIMQKYSSDKKSDISGYTLQTDVVPFGDGSISKLVQSAIGDLPTFQRGARFVTMINELQEENPGVSYLVEIGAEFTNLGILFERAGFHPVYDEALADAMMLCTLGPHQWELEESELGLYVARKTMFSDDYKALLLTNHTQKA